MRRTFLARNLFIGVLMGLVMVLGVQEIADALTFGTSKTGDLQTVVEDNEFTISFSVSLGGNTTAIRDSQGKLIKDSSTDGGAAGARIDSAGYLVVEIDGREYRTIEGTPSGTLVIDPRPPYSTKADGTAADPDAAGTATPDYYVDRSGNVVDSTGAAVYVRTGTGDRPGSDPWRYTRAKADPTDQVPAANRYHYNEESISILAPTDVDLRRVGSHSVSVAGGTAHTMDEMKNSVNEDKLTGSIRLTYFVDTAGKYEITITDTTPDDDRPVAAVPPLRFTIFVVPSYDGSTVLGLTGAGADGFETRNDNADPRVDALFSKTGTAAANAPIIYSVEGSGSLYVKETYTGGSPTSQSSATRTLSTSSAAMVYLDMRGSSNKVTAYVRDQNAIETGKTIYFIFNYAQIEIISGNNQTGVPDSRLRDPLRIRVKDAKGRALSGLAVMFTPAGGATLEPVIGTDVYLTASTATPANAWAATFDTIDKTFQATRTVPADIAENAAALVPTNRSGEAQVYLQVGDAGNKTVGVSAGGANKTFYATSSQSTDIPSLEIVSGNNQRSASNGKVANPLMVRVLASNNQPLPTELVTFTTIKGYLTTPSEYQDDGSDGRTATTNGPATQVTAVTDVNGRAAVRYDLVNHEGAADVIAEISRIGTAPYQRRVTFNINGRAIAPITTVVTGDDGDDGDDDNTPTNKTLTISPAAGLSGTAGELVQLGVTTDSNNPTVTITGNTAFQSGGGRVAQATSTQTGTTLWNVRLPTTVGTTYSLTVNASGFDPETVPVTVTAGTTTSGDTTETATSGTLSVSGPISGAPGTAISVTVRARDTANAAVGSLSIRLTADAAIGTLAQTSVVTNASGLASTVLTLSSTPGATGFVRASASGYIDNGGRRFSVSTTTDATTEETQDEEEEEEETVREPASIEISGPATRSGTANTALEAVLLVRVLDADDAAVEDVRVTFRVREGRGELSQKGNRRGIIIYTDSNGHARAPYTPISASSTVEASVPGVQETVTFTIRATGAPASTDTSDTKQDTPRTTRDTTSDTVSPTVLVAAAKRPPMLWVADGKMYTLVSTDVQEFVPSASNVMNIAIGGGKVYWTEKTSASSGTINSANLDGSDAKELKSLLAIPIGIGVDVPNSKLYWTNSRGRIQSANLDGSGIQNVMENIRNPNDLALAGGNVYWTESNHGSVRFVNLRGQKQVRVISTGDDPAGSLVIGGGKVYWTEKVGESGGTINAANLNGSEATELTSTFATPIGIAVDTARNKLFWTNDRGRVQTASLSGSSIRNVVNGLESPGEILLSNSLKETPKATPTKSTTTAARKNKYDINGDGKVDSTDTGLVVLAISTGDTSAKLDVNGDGKVNFSDYVLVSENVDAGTAGAPSVFGMKMSAAQIERLQEQIELLIASGDRSPAAMRALIYFQQLIATARPEKTQLLANYPNPFNPETWMPYELATNTNVKITIYNTQGVVIRTLELGQQSAGYYTGRERAAYWDGRNAFGEQVASGIYFYQLETDTMSALRKMVILK